jgi:RES domain-containing protein
VDRSLVERVAAVGASTVQGRFYRHAAPNRDAFAGGTDGRWGQNFPVIYLGRPPDSVVVEAYRHLVEEAGMAPERVRPRTFYTVQVDVKRVLDLTEPANLTAVGLDEADLRTAVDDYAACQAVAAAAHQLELHGVLAPAASGLGQTLAIFRSRVSTSELPIVQSELLWPRLPADPRQLRVIRATGTEPSP